LSFRRGLVVDLRRAGQQARLVMTKRRTLVGLLGANIQGSMSPALFADAFAAAGIDGYYHLLDVDRLPGRLPQLFEAIKTAGFIGANVTFPFKQEIIPLLDAVDPSAAQVGAVNTVVFAPDGRATGYNFDRAGWRNSFDESIGSASAKDATVVQIGTGGAGRAVAFALMDLGVADLVLHDLDPARANALQADLARHYGPSRCRLAQDLERDIAAAAGVVNATQVGMRGFPGNPVPVAALKASHWAADVIYTPMQTEFLKAAAAKGARTLNGTGMCVHQAVEAFAQLTGVAPDPARLHRAFATAVAARDAALPAAT
jgi:shikimate dehydrogenase